MNNAIYQRLISHVLARYPRNNSHEKTYYYHCFIKRDYFVIT
jgi:hypothetical protein